jgi:hypothetical protein
MSAWLGVSPLIGAGSLDGFAIGALASGACFLAIAAPRRARKRREVALSEDPAFGSDAHDGWLCEHVMAAEAFPADAERLAQPDISGVQPPGHAGRIGAADDAARIGATGPEGVGLVTTTSAGQAGQGLGHVYDGLSGTTAPGQSLGQAFLASGSGRTSGSYRSRHRRLERSTPGSAAPRRRFGGASALRKAAWPDNLVPAGTSQHTAFPDSAPDDDESRGGAHHPPELAFPDGTFGSSKRPEVRSLPRHAAPGISLSSRLSAGMNTLMTSLSATRAMLGGAHG